MKIRGLLVATFVFCILGGFLYWSEHHKPSETAKASADTSPVILKLDPSTITKLDVKKKDSEAIVLAKADSGKWQITEPKPFGADQNTVSGMLSTLSSLNSDRVVEDQAADLKQYGLDPPALELDVTEKNNKTQKLLIGDDTPASGAFYAMLKGDPRVFTIPTYSKTSVDKSVDDLRDKRLLTVNPDKISRIELIQKNEDLEFGRNKDEWQILKPKPLRADTLQVGELARKLTDARMDLTASDSKDAETAFAHGAAIAIAKVTDESGTQELQVRENKDTYYAKSSAVDGAYKINADVGQAVAKKLEDFRNKKLFDFAYSDPNKIELHDGSKAYSLTRNGEDWWSNGKKMDAETVQSLVSKLRDLAADKFPDSGFGSPAIMATVTSNDGKRVEKVQIAKSKTGYIAKREDEPTLYELSSSSVDDLQKAAEGVKPAEPAAKHNP
jgi:hypothetical protein